MADGNVKAEIVSKRGHRDSIIPCSRSGTNKTTRGRKERNTSSEEEFNHLHLYNHRVPVVMKCNVSSCPD